MAEIKIKDLRTGEVHLLKSFTKTQCGINIKRNESKWVIVGIKTSITCRKRRCNYKKKRRSFIKKP